MCVQSGLFGNCTRVHYCTHSKNLVRITSPSATGLVNQEQIRSQCIHLATLDDPKVREDDMHAFFAQPLRNLQPQTLPKFLDR